MSFNGHWVIQWSLGHSMVIGLFGPGLGEGLLGGVFCYKYSVSAGT